MPRPPRPPCRAGLGRVPPVASALACLAAAVLVPLLAATPAHAQSDPSYLVVTSDLAARNGAAVARGVAYLKSVQNEDGSWGTDADGGRTSLVTLALLNAGESYAGEPVQRALRFVRRQEAPNTYAVGLRAALAAQLPEKMAGDLMRREVADLARGDRDGLFGYVVGQPGTPRDFSNSQYAALGAWYAAEAGMSVPRSFWKRVEQGWLAGQNDDGGWGYQPRTHASYGSMTAAGAATLSITDEYLNAADALNLNRPRRNQPLDRAIAWLAVNFAVDYNPGRDRPAKPVPTEAEVAAESTEPGTPDAPTDAPTDAAPAEPQPPASDPSNPFLPAPVAPAAPEAEVPEPPAPAPPAAPDAPAAPLAKYGSGYWVNYMLFGYERVGEATGLTRFGPHAWFDEGAGYLLDNQADDGSWHDTYAADVSTAYALLFLSRGRAPVAFQKLAYDGRWNDRPRDVSRTARWLSRQLERHLNWQVVAADAPPEDYDAAPVLYVAGHRPLRLTAQGRANLRDYVRRGGLVVFVNEGPDSRFADSVKTLCADLFPPFEFRALPDDHPIVAGNYPARAIGGPVLGLSNGVRELAVLLPDGDVSYRLHAGPTDAAAVNTPFGLMGNVFLYATGGRPPLLKGQTTWVARDDDQPAPDRAVRVVRLKHASNWNPEPAAWERLANVMHNAGLLEVTVETADLSDPESQIPNPKSQIAGRPPTPPTLLSLTDTLDFKLAPAEMTSLTTALDGGDLLLFDAAGGSPAAGSAFDALMRDLYPGRLAVAPLPPDHPIYGGPASGGAAPATGTVPVKTVAWRLPADGRARPEPVPRLKGYSVDGRLVAVASDDDLSAGLVGDAMPVTSGYAPADAARLAGNLLLWVAAGRE